MGSDTMRITLVLTAFALLFSVQGVTASTIYVPDDYSSIQAAIDHASEGDTIIVRDGTYLEDVFIDKQLTIKSENGSSGCIVDGARAGFTLSANSITVKGFNITSTEDGRGISVESDGNTITENNITGNRYGIYLDFTMVCEIDGYDNNAIIENTITRNWAGIASAGDNNKVRDNNFSNNELDRFAIPIPTPHPCGDISCYTYVQEGSILSGDKKPVNASVSILSADRQKVTGDDGRVNFDDLKTGEHEVKAVYNYSTFSKNVEVQEDSEAVVEFDFAKASETNRVPGFESIFSIAGLVVAAYLMRRL
ncbi:MAG: NosD domain-containing protein [Archaeoglobaceae archaeon]